MNLCINDDFPHAVSPNTAILHMCVGLGGGDDGGGGCGIVVGSTDPENMRLFPLLPTDCWGLRLICSQCWHSYGGIASKILTTQNSFLAGPLPPSQPLAGAGEILQGRGGEETRIIVGIMAEEKEVAEMGVE